MRFAVALAVVFVAIPAFFVLLAALLGGRCTVCGHHANTLVMFPNHREVRHQPGGGRPCVLPNPPAAPVKAEVAS